MSYRDWEDVISEALDILMDGWGETVVWNVKFGIEDFEFSELVDGFDSAVSKLGSRVGLPVSKFGKRYSGFRTWWVRVRMIEWMGGCY